MPASLLTNEISYVTIYSYISPKEKRMTESIFPKSCADFLNGKCTDSYTIFGNRVCEININGKKACGVFFSLWAPAAISVRVIGDFNAWGSIENESGYMQKAEYGVWTCFIEGASSGQRYKYRITRMDGSVIDKADPYTRYSELRPATASVITEETHFKWTDEAWLRYRAETNWKKSPINIYEVHLGSWMRGDIEGLDYEKDWREVDKRKAEEPFLNYRDIADRLTAYIKKMNYTHVEIMPIPEHPLDGSWGYQTLCYYSVTSRYGSPDDFRYFVDKLHSEGMGVILDWVPGHFCKDDAGLYNLDGNMPYEPKDRNKRENIWGTANFDLGKGAVRSFLISNAMYFLREFHIDGIRADAVANILYHDYEHGGPENKDGADFLRALNYTVHSEMPDVLMIAEDSSTFPGVTHDVRSGGIGFDFKWNMGWMNDTLEYMKAEYPERRQIHNKMTFSLFYAFSESYILPISHDEVVHGKKSLVDKMSGDYDAKFASLRCFCLYMMTHPGKKLSFMGNEIAQFMEWRYYEEIEWKLLLYPKHEALRKYVSDLNRFYRENKALWEADDAPEGFKWIDADNKDQSVFTYIRYAEDKDDFLVIVCNFTPVSYENFRIGVPRFADYMPVFSSSELGAEDEAAAVRPEPTQWNGMPFHIQIKLNGYGALIYRPVFRKKINDLK